MNVNNEMQSREEEHFDYILRWALMDALEQEGVALLAEHGEEDGAPLSQRLTTRIHKIVCKARRRQNKLEKRPMPLYLKRALVGVLALALAGCIVTGGANAFLTSIRNVWQTVSEDIASVIFAGALIDGGNVGEAIYTGDIPEGMVEDSESRRVEAHMMYTKFTNKMDWFTFKVVKQSGPGGSNDINEIDLLPKDVVIGGYPGKIATGPDGVTRLYWSSDEQFWKLTSSLSPEEVLEMAKSVR